MSRSKIRRALPLGLIHVRLRLSNLLTGQSELRRCRLSARPRRTETAEYDLTSAHCGRIAIEAACCRIYDPFGLIGIRLKQTVLAQTTVQPKGFAQTIFISPDANCPDDSESYAPDRAGYDLSEVYQLREYRSGDSLRQMHWKLSGKLDRLVIREASLPVLPFSAALLGADTEGGAEETDAQADVVVTFCRSLLEAGVQFTIAWNDATEQRCVSQQIRSMDELIACCRGCCPRGRMRASAVQSCFCEAAARPCSRTFFISRAVCGAGISAGAVWAPDGAQLRSQAAMEPSALTVNTMPNSSRELEI